MATIAIAIVVLGAILWAAHIARADELFVLAVAPSFYLLWHFHHADKYKSEPIGLLLGTFTLGGVCAIIAAFVEPGPPQNAGLGLTFLYFLFGVALIEEFAKFLVVRLLPYRSKQFDEAMDGVVFGIAAGLGFAAVENILYVFSYGGAVALFRAFVSVPGHAFYGAVMGYYVGEAKARKMPWLALRGLTLAILLHGVFDTLAQVTGWLALLLLPAFVWFVYFAVVKKEIAQAQSESLYRPAP
ncbi:MAG TPA: PrsW family glutamic-type intramembrane protease [Candidatus Dormibacteraeota bacterium]|nr:PrsW family glutamic-type intramembrane protease [Candidatus Dormibacteraeota bacterium]